MTEHKPEQTAIMEELKELGRQLTATMRTVASSEQVRSLGQELKDGLREAAQNVEEAWDKVRERDEVQRLQARASDVAESFKTGEAQQEIRQEIQEALHSLNLRLQQLVERMQPSSEGTVQTPPSTDSGTTASSGQPYTNPDRKSDA